LIRAEIEQLDCANAHVALPESLVQAGMQQGKVAFPWRALRGWIKPTPPPVVSKHDQATLELPLEVLMPLFLTRWKQTPKTQPKLVVDESIPALFAPAAAAEIPVAPEQNSSNDTAATTDATASSPKTPGTDFKNRYISPTEVVTRATTLSGVAGALVVLPEGLLVASKLSGGQDPDALAAFLAQAMSRITQFAKEAEVGELSRLEFWANNVHWLVFRLNGIYFVSFGWAGGELPTAELASMAAALDRKRKD
jgi:predicted regulator of Ras-like GTPase activity (Roadblock/LC7/MglB family)